jgi:hypothetical protein
VSVCTRGRANACASAEIFVSLSRDNERARPCEAMRASALHGSTPEYPHECHLSVPCPVSTPRYPSVERVYIDSCVHAIRKSVPTESPYSYPRLHVYSMSTPGVPLQFPSSASQEPLGTPFSTPCVALRAPRLRSSTRLVPFGAHRVPLCTPRVHLNALNLFSTPIASPSSATPSARSSTPCESGPHLRRC